MFAFEHFMQIFTELEADFKFDVILLVILVILFITTKPNPAFQRRPYPSAICSFAAIFIQICYFQPESESVQTLGV